MFAKYTLNYVLFDEISLLLLPLHPSFPVFLTSAIVFLFPNESISRCFLTLESTAIIQDFAYSICAKDVCR